MWYFVLFIILWLVFGYGFFGSLISVALLWAAWEFGPLAMLLGADAAQKKRNA
jgi:hypothetical protein